MKTTENCNGLISALMYNALAGRDLRIAEVFRRTYIEPADQSIESQIAMANNYWRIRLGQVCNTHSIAAREALIDCDMENWIRLFHAEVAPRIIRLDLTL